MKGQKTLLLPGHLSSSYRCVLILTILVSWTLAVEQPEFEIQGYGWSDAGRIMHVTDTLEVNLNGNWYQSAGAQFTAVASIGENWEGAFGFGGFQEHNSLGSAENATLARVSFLNYITQGRMTYFRGDKSDPSFSLTFGNFPYKYNKDVKNLGLYLLRGPVYPGLLMSGFKDFRADTTKGDILGLRMYKALGDFSFDVIFSNEREMPPTFDWHLALVAQWKASSFFQMGTGVNFYRLLSANKDLTDITEEQYLNEFPTKDHPYDALFIEVDTTIPGQPDTTFFTHRGTKLMAYFNLDLGEALGMEANQFKLYGETALLGVKNYGSVYNKMSERIPVMFGLNLPTFGLLDVFSLELEWYGAKYRNDTRKLENGGWRAAIPSPIPVSRKEHINNTDNWGFGLDSNGYLMAWNNDSAKAIATDTKVEGTGLDVQNLTTDDWKWSVNIEKIVGNHVQFAAQIANDHFRPKEVFTSPINVRGGTQEAFTDLSDWYLMFRVGYFF